MPWVLRGIPDPELWLIETDPRKEEMVVVQQEDVEGVFRKAKLKDKLKTTMGLLRRLRSRSTSSVNVLGGGPGSVVSSAASEVSTSTARADNTSRSGGGYSTPTAGAAGTSSKSGLGIKKGFRTSTPAQPRALPGSSSIKGKSRESAWEVGSVWRVVDVDESAREHGDTAIEVACNSWIVCKRHFGAYSGYAWGTVLWRAGGYGGE